MSAQEHDPDCLSHGGGRYCDCQGLVRPMDPERKAATAAHYAEQARLARTTTERDGFARE